MNKINFGLALHFHQPVGNFDSVIERAHSLCYKPFIDTLFNYPDITANFHVSGPLLDWFEEKHPETLDTIKKMVERSQVEMIGGAYYEPILLSIPERDILGQIKMMTGYIKKRFGYEVSGMWVPERVWEPRLVKPIALSGIKYSILDDTHFLLSGVKQADLHGYFVTGDGAEKLAVFPSDKRLRYTIPFKQPNETIDFFRKAAEAVDGRMFTYGDDIEKFGEWPGTHDWVFKEGWLRKFFDALLENREWIDLVKLSNYLKTAEPTGKLTIQPASYEEMIEWTGGSWLNFLEKYPESNQMQKKMVYVSGKLEALEKHVKKSDARSVEEIRKELYKGQCNCGYWHGVFGGLYLYHLRSAIYSHLIEADKKADELAHQGKKDWGEVREVDYDQDGKNEVVIENRDFSLCVDPEEGAAIKEVDFRPDSFNFANTLSRKKEVYHEKILNSAGKSIGGEVANIHDEFREVDPSLLGKLVYDRFPRYWLRTFFVPHDLVLEAVKASAYGEIGDFANSPYKVKLDKGAALFERRAKVFDKDIIVSKSIRIKSSRELEFQITVDGPAIDKLAALAIEFNLVMPDLNSDRYKYESGGASLAGLNNSGVVEGSRSFGIKDEKNERGIRFDLSEPASEIFYYPVETVSQSERAYELNYQCSSVLFKLSPSLSKGGKWIVRFNCIVV